MRDATTNFEAEGDRLVAGLAAVKHVLDEYRDELDDRPEARPIRELARAVPGELSDMLKDGRLLRLGVVGQIKAGKSTLLNLLLFDGREVLPKAATPMTAALTHIVHSDEIGAGKAEIEVDFYSRDEWQEIVQHAGEYRKAKQGKRDPGELLRACHELVEMAARRGVSIMDHTGTDIRPVAVDDLNEELNRLVGAEGKLAPLVKSVTIRCGEGFPDLDIVDTPGLNDPIKSRGRATRKLLAKCDAVLLLSYAGQFMDSSDLKLLRNTLPDEAIHRYVVIGSKFDSALIDVAPNYRRDLQKAAVDIEKRLREHATTKSQRPDGDGHPFEARDVVFVSAMCAVLGAKRNAGRWSAAERDAFDSLRSSYPDWFDSPEDDRIYDDTAHNLVELVGRRAGVDTRIHDIRDDKDNIIRGKVRDYLRKKRDAAKDCISNLIGELEKYLEQVGTVEVKQLEDQRLKAQKAMDSISDKVMDLWMKSLATQRKGVDKARKDFSKRITEARQEIEDSVSTKTAYRRKKKAVGVLGFGYLMRRITGEDQYELDPYERRVIDETSLQLALDEAYDKFRTIVHGQLREMFHHGFYRKVVNDLGSAMANSLDNDIASIVDRSLRSSLNQAVEQIAAHARGEITKHTAGDSLSRLEFPKGSTDSKQSIARTYVNALSDYGDKVLKDAEGIMAKTIEKAKSDLTPVAVQNIKEYYDGLERDISERESKLPRYQQAIDELRRCGERLGS